VGATHPGLGKMDSTAPSSTPLSGGALLRHSSFVRAVCVNALVRICAGGDQRWSSLLRPELEKKKLGTETIIKRTVPKYPTLDWHERYG
jgi:hypothetical protein